MKTVFNVAAVLTGVFVAALALGVLIADWERPPMEAKQIGYRGVAMEQVTNPRTAAKTVAAQQVPEADPPAPEGGQRASAVYENVQILGDLTEDEFNRIMVAITNWVSPEQGCGYCHNLENLAEDVPMKVIARRMFQMTKHVNQGWTDHVKQVGVTCYTCHRGQNVPGEVWFEGPGDKRTRGFFGYDAGQNHPGMAVGLTSLPNDPFSGQINQDANVRVVGTTALPTEPGPSLKKAESTYALMIHMSTSLGVNCTFCHNSRAFLSWDQSVPTRNSAWYGLRMVRDLNSNYVTPLKPLYQESRLGPQGDAPKLNCATCHRGQNKPFGGTPMLQDYPELNATALEPVAGPPPATQ